MKRRTKHEQVQRNLGNRGAGKTGRRAAERLTQKGLPVRIASRSTQPSFDWENPDTWLPALEGVESAYVTYYPDLAFPEAADRIRAFSKLAVENGVRRLVLLAGRGEEGAELSEQHLKESGADWTIIGASFFFQNFSENLFVEQLLTGEIAFPVCNVPDPFIDADDIADVVTEVMTQPGHIGKTYELTGPRLMTFADVIADIAKASGREIRLVPVTPEEYTAAMIESGLPADFANSLTELFTTALDGRSSYLADGVRRVLGREPRDFAAYARQTAATGVWTPTA